MGKHKIVQQMIGFGYMNQTRFYEMCSPCPNRNPAFIQSNLWINVRYSFKVHIQALTTPTVRDSQYISSVPKFFKLPIALNLSFKRLPSSTKKNQFFLQENRRTESRNPPQAGLTTVFSKTKFETFGEKVSKFVFQASSL